MMVVGRLSQELSAVLSERRGDIPRSRISKKEIPCVFTFKPHSTLCHFHSIENDFHLHTYILPALLFSNNKT